MTALARALALILLVATGCNSSPVVDLLEGMPVLEVSDDRVAVPAVLEARIAIDAHLPTDLQPLPDGGFAVLDGYGHRIFVYDASGASVRLIQGDSTWGQPVRFLLSGDGFWMTDPGDDSDPGGVLRVGPDGKVLELISSVPGAVAIAERGGRLVLSDREGTLREVDPAFPELVDQLELADDKSPARLVSDLTMLEDGTLVALDSLTPRMQFLPKEGEPEALGRFGHHVGALRMPKGIAELPLNELVVVDSLLGAVQIFDRRARALGPLVVDDSLLRLDHPVAVRVLTDGRIAVLAAGSSEVVLLRVEAASIAAAHGRSWLKHLRVSLAPPGLDDSEPCLHCHDGFVRDSRANWDPEREHHPVHVKPEEAVPDFFQLDDEGRLVCSTCHSPHGEVGLTQSRTSDSDDARLQLVRHRTGGMSFLRLGKEDSELCLACHEDAAHGGMTERDGLVADSSSRPGHLVGRALADALARRPDATEADVAKGSCLGCHAVHAAGSEPLLRAADNGATCLGCHGDHGRSARNHPLGRAFGGDTPKPGASARLVLGPDAGIGCATCHDVLAGKGDSLLRPTASGGMLCLACHTDRKALTGSGHGKIRARGKRGLPACLGCHDVHGESKDDHLLVLHGDEDPTGCRTCHQPGGVAAKKGLNPGILGHVVEDAGEGDHAITDCRTCHDVHDVDKPLRSCTDCHEDQATSAARGGHGDAECADCHPAHRSLPGAPPTAGPANPSSRPCLVCHAEDSLRGSDKKLAAWSHPETVFMPDGSRWEPLGDVPLFNDAGEVVPKGQNGNLACLSCHLVHGPAEDGSHDKLRRPAWKATCAACHGSDALPLYRYFHQPERRENAVGDRP